MRIAVDVDNTIYDTDKCSLIAYQQMAKKLGMKVPSTRKEAHKWGYKQNKHMLGLRSNPEIWFNSEYLINEAIMALKEYVNQYTNIELYIMTARSVNLKYYDKLLKGTGLKIKGIIQQCDFSTKVDGCIKYDIDVLVDDNLRNLAEHKEYVKGKGEGYKTKFIHYIGHSEDAQTECIKDDNSSYNVYTMRNWNEFFNIMERIGDEDEKGA